LNSTDFSLEIMILGHSFKKNTLIEIISGPATFLGEGQC